MRSYGFYSLVVFCILILSGSIVYCQPPPPGSTGPTSWPPGTGTITSVNPVKIIDGGVKIYPNPNNGSFTLKLDKQKDGELRIYSINGSIVFQKKFNNQLSFKIDLPFSISDGIYFVEMTSKTEKLTERFIVRRP